MAKHSVVRSAAALLNEVNPVSGVSKIKRSPTAYEKKVYQLCKAIPAGKVTTYGDMAKALGSSPRAIGQAMRRNPFAPVVPCHRVIATNMQLGGFSGQWGNDCAFVQKKKAMLEQEGIAFNGASVASPEAILHEDQLRKLLQE
eukprot:jgi/Chrzof1/7917/Cz02g41070.t1